MPAEETIVEWKEGGFTLRVRKAARAARRRHDGEIVYHRALIECCILAGDTDDGGLDMEIPVAGLTMGIALRPRGAAGCCSFMLDCWLWNAVLGGTKGGEEVLRENPGATDWGCWVGDDCGELLAREDRSDALEIETKSFSVSKLGQNSRSSSSSKELAASNFERNAEMDADSLSSFMLRTPRNCL
jgi:hypothetical protein